MSVLEDFLSQHVPATAATYRRGLAEAATAVHPVPLERATSADLIHYQRGLSAQAMATQARKLSTCAAFFLFLRQTGRRLDDPMVGIRRPRVDRLRAIRPVSADQQLRIIEAAADSRELAVVWILAHGLRSAEVVDLDASSLQADTLRVTGKGAKVREVVLERDAVAAIRGYLGQRRKGPLLLGRRGRLTTRQLQRIVAVVSGRVGDEINPHALRHSFALSMVRSGTNLAVLQRMLGHASPTTTAAYLALDGTDMRAAITRAPLAKRAADQRMSLIPGGQGDVPGAEPLGRKTAPSGVDSRP